METVRPARRRQIEVISNCFKMSYNPDRPIYRLSVFISEVPESEEGVRRRIMSRIGRQLWETFNSKFVFANTMLYVASLPVSEDEPEASEYSFTASLDDRAYDIILRKVGIIERENEHEATHFYNKFMKEALRTLRYTQIGTRLFNPAKERPVDRANVTLWPGYSVNCIRTQAGCFVKIDSSYKAIHIGTVLDSIRREMRNADYQAKIKTELVKRVVVTRYNKRLYRVDDVAFNLNPESTFTNSAEEQLTYVEYYRSINQNITDLRQPLLVSSIRSRGGDRMVVHLIPEFCVLTGVTNETRAAVSRHTIVKPNLRLKETLELAADLNKPTLEPILSKWNVTVSSEPLVLTAEVINTNAIVLEMARGRTINPRRGGMFEHDVKSKMHTEGVFRKLAVIYPERDEGIAREFMEALVSLARTMNFDFNFDFAKFPIRSSASSEWLEALERICSVAGVEDFIIAFLPGSKKQAPLYDEFKEQLIQRYGLGSQVVLTDTARDRGKRESICTKVLIQINAKTGGIPWVVRDMPLSDSTMLVGIEELRHRTAGNFIGIVSTFGRGLNAPYFSQIVSDYSAAEAAIKIKQSILSACRRYFDENQNVAPKRVIIYSSSLDDVQSELHHDSVIQALEEAMREVETNTHTRPALVYAVVSRKTNFRFYVSRTSTDNLEQGTIINTGLVNSYSGSRRFSFFLLSLQSRLGVTIPCQYDVIHNTAGVSREDMELLSYKQCYLYYNVSGPCKFPAPLYYAYKLVTMFSERTIKLGRFLEPHPNWGRNYGLYFI
jgi:aubergine-like protein